MRLYVLPGACSLASHIALETVAEVVPEGSRPWEVVVLERGHNYDPDYTAINPIGTVPALVTTDGRLIVESLAVLLHIAEAYPEARIVPPTSDVDRDRILTLLSLMVTAGHTAFQMLWRSERFADTEAGRESVQRMCEPRIGALFERIECEIGEAGYLVGDRLSVADMYLFVLGRWAFASHVQRVATPSYGSSPNAWQTSERCGGRWRARALNCKDRRPGLDRAGSRPAGSVAMTRRRRQPPRISTH
jgi:glutathione S-transferase